MALHFSTVQIADVKQRVDLVKLAVGLGADLRQRGTRHIGSCPLCGGGRRATRFEINNATWVCAVCNAGGDAIALLQKARHLTFAEAVEQLGGARTLSEAEKQKLSEERAAREYMRAKEQAQYRAREIARCRAIWDMGLELPSNGYVMRYLRSRHVMAPRSACLREVPRLGFYNGEVSGRDGKAHPRLLFEGPAMVAAFVNAAGRFSGVHITWLAQDGSGKAQIADPDTGESLPAKKMRGHKLGSHIVLRSVMCPQRLFIAEGIETALSVAVALHRTGRLQPDDAFWAAGDLGNLGGPHKGTIVHPTLKNTRGAPLRIPGPEPAEGEAICIPDCLRHLVLLGDGDSEPVLTRHALERARARYAHAGLRIALAVAEPGADFNDMLEAA